MEKRNMLLALVLLVCLAAAILFGLTLQPGPAQAPEQAIRDIVISELCTKNETVIADNDGKYRDYIELYNGGGTVDLTGCYLTDGKVNSPKFTDLIMEPGEYRLIFLGDSLVGFGLGAAGGDCIQLIDPYGTIITQTNTTALSDDQVMILEDGHYTVSDQPSPGFPNDRAGIAAFRNGKPSENASVVISEVLLQNLSALPDAQGLFCDIIELCNTSDAPVRLGRWWLSDDKESRFRYRLPDITLEPGAFLLLWCDGENTVTENGEIHTNFALSLGETLCLTDPTGGCAALELRYVGEDVSIARIDGSYSAAAVSLGCPNTDEGSLRFLESRMDLDAPLVISEVLLSAGETPYNGLLQDVVEITNRSGEAVSTAGWYLSDGGDPFEYPLPDKTLQPGEQLVILCSPQTTGFGISQGETLRLTCPDYRYLPELQCLSGAPGQSMSLMDTAELSYDFAPVTLGYPNTSENALVFLAEQSGDGLLIWEVISANASYIKGAYAKTCDWLELYNASDKDISLSDYCLTNNADTLGEFPLPDQILPAGGYCVILLSNDETNLAPGYPVLPMTLSSEGENLYLSRDGVIADYVFVPRLPQDVSYGRPDGSLLFDTLGAVTPGKPNGEAARISAAPTALTAQGSYDGVESLEVVLEGDGIIYYTTDCTAPNSRDSVYTGPIRLTQTTVIRAICVEEGKKESPVTDLTYLINENDSLSAVCIVTEPTNLYHNATGIFSTGYYANEAFPFFGANYWQDWERQATVSLFEADGSLGFTSPCGIKVFGGFSRAYDRKSVACFFRGSYGAGTLNYPLFGEEGLDTYEVFVLRAGGQDIYRSLMRDEVITSIAADHTRLAVQQYRPVVVYFNGGYAGVYYIREKLNEHYVSGHYGADPSTVQICEANGGGSREYMDMVRFARYNDLSDPENYAYICSQVDIEVYMDYIITQIYIGNTDNANVKFFKTAEGKWHWILYDTDLSFLEYGFNSVEDHLNPAGTAAMDYISTDLINGLLDNPEFYDAFLRRFAWHLNTVWTQENVSARVDEIKTLVEADMHKFKDGKLDSWYTHVERLKEYARIRPSYLLEDIRAYFGLTKAEMRGYGFDI